MRVFWIIGVFFPKPCQLQPPLSLASWWLEVETVLEKFLFVWLACQSNRYVIGSLILLLNHCVGQLGSNLRASSLVVPAVDDTLFDQVDTCQCSAVALSPHMKPNTDWNPPLSFFPWTSLSNSLWLGYCQNLSRIQSLLTPFPCLHFVMSSCNPLLLPRFCFVSLLSLHDVFAGVNMLKHISWNLPCAAVLRRANLFLVLLKPDALSSGLVPFLFWTGWPCFVPHTHTPHLSYCVLLLLTTWTAVFSASWSGQPHSCPGFISSITFFLVLSKATVYSSFVLLFSP